MKQDDLDSLGMTREDLKQIGIPTITYKDALKKLGIEDFSSRIFHSNSHGELFHLLDYCAIAESINGDADTNGFREVFLEIVAFCEKSWSRPESCFQHMPKLINQYLGRE